MQLVILSMENEMEMEILNNLLAWDYGRENTLVTFHPYPAHTCCCLCGQMVNSRESNLGGVDRNHVTPHIAVCFGPHTLKPNTMSVRNNLLMNQLYFKQSHTWPSDTKIATRSGCSWSTTSCLVQQKESIKQFDEYHR